MILEKEEEILRYIEAMEAQNCNDHDTDYEETSPLQEEERENTESENTEMISTAEAEIEKLCETLRRLRHRPKGEGGNTILDSSCHSRRRRKQTHHRYQQLRHQGSGMNAKDERASSVIGIRGDHKVNDSFVLSSHQQYSLPDIFLGEAGTSKKRNSRTNHDNNNNASSVTKMSFSRRRLSSRKSLVYNMSSRTFSMITN